MSITYALIFIKTNVDTAEPGPGINDVGVNPEPNSNYQSVKFLWRISPAKPGNNHTIPDDYTYVQFR